MPEYPGFFIKLKIMLNLDHLAWLVVMLHCSRHPAISVYTTRTFGIIAFKYFQVLIFYSPILIGFAVCFSVLFNKYADAYKDLPDEEKLWPSISMSLLKMLTMMAGDIESDGLFVEFRRLSSYYSRVRVSTKFQSLFGLDSFFNNQLL